MRRQPAPAGLCSAICLALCALRAAGSDIRGADGWLDGIGSVLGALKDTKVTVEAVPAAVTATTLQPSPPEPDAALPAAEQPSAVQPPPGKTPGGPKSDPGMAPPRATAPPARTPLPPASSLPQPSAPPDEELESGFMPMTVAPTTLPMTTTNWMADIGSTTTTTFFLEIGRATKEPHRAKHKTVEPAQNPLARFADTVHRIAEKLRAGRKNDASPEATGTMVQVLDDGDEESREDSIENDAMKTTLTTTTTTVKTTTVPANDPLINVDRTISTGLHRFAINTGKGVPPDAFGFGLHSRPYLLYVPSSYSPLIPTAVWLHCPGAGVEMDTVYQHNAVMADRHSVAMVILSGLGNKMSVGHNAMASIHYPNDVSYTRAVLAEVMSKINVDMKRISCVGYSRGARFCSRLASELSSFVTAIAAVSGVRYPHPNNASRPIPVIAFHGVHDPINPYHGGGPEYWSESVPDSVRRWSTFNGCAKSQKHTPRAGVEVTRYSDCVDNADVVLVKLLNGNHDWPNSAIISARLDILQFFQEHPGTFDCYTVKATSPRFQQCYKHLGWAMKQGIKEQPDLYDNLTRGSPPSEFQRVMHKYVYADCPTPCGNAGGDDDLKDILADDATGLWRAKEAALTAASVELNGHGGELQRPSRGASLWMLGAALAGAAAVLGLAFLARRRAPWSPLQQHQVLSRRTILAEDEPSCRELE